MRCVEPKTIRKNGYLQHVPCGACSFCLQAKRDDWSFRIGREFQSSKAASFITLTYSDENVPMVDCTVGDDEETIWHLPSLVKRDLQLFIKKLRKFDFKARSTVPMKGITIIDKKIARISLKTHPIKYYAVGEYGSKTDRPHYHAIVFNMEKETTESIANIWKLGHVHVGTVTEASINYVTKYVITSKQKVLPDGMEKPFALISNKMGADYLKKNGSHHKNHKKDYVVQNGFKKRMPRYYRQEVFNRVERDIFNQKTKKRADEKEEEELHRISKFNDNPYAYRQEQLHRDYERIRDKSRDDKI